jgi:alkylated DNA repair dioxygenase AlkB
MIPGLDYIPSYLDDAQQRALLDTIDAQPWGGDLARRVQQYGWRYDFRNNTITAQDRIGPLPDWLAAIAQRLLDDGHTDVLATQAILNEYEPGQGIALHIDGTAHFGPIITSLSLLSPAVMRFVHAHDGRELELRLDPGSLLVLRDEARNDWRHGIARRTHDTLDGHTWPRARRVSLTLRTMSR